ncbi:hypothetical protein [Escherichia phage FFH2]|uniref:Uncharacterized protein n=1 Tax=Escherichia phage FFH2 TaxID=1446490 RepID=A0A023MHU9_9CAUD|nr:hypothetical protein FG37_gp127 [Escherichia phage FFH2]AHN83747.1 hypothetical protein [Escherichia phage FFH2]
MSFVFVTVITFIAFHGVYLFFVPGGGSFYHLMYYALLDGCLLSNYFNDNHHMLY